MDSKASTTPSPVQSPSARSMGDTPGSGMDLIGLLESEKRVFELLAADRRLDEILNEIAHVWEKHSSRYPHCTLMVADESGGTLELIAAPSLPLGFRALRRRFAVGPDSNGCGMSAWNKRPLLVADLREGPWPRHAAELLEFGLRSGWAEPILSSRGRLLGVLAVYARETASPSSDERILMERLIHLARIAVERDRATRAIARLSSSDVLTGLPNRSALLDRLDGALLEDAGEGRATALLLFNLDGMKQINDALGYEFGDRCIKSLVLRLQQELPAGAVFARVGGDEFGVVLQAVKDKNVPRHTAQSLLEKITEPLRIDERDVFLTASLGASVGPGDGADADTLFKRADAALHHAKQRGRNGFQFYAAHLDASAAHRLTLLADLRHALERGEFHLEYQPQVELESGHIRGAEALLRWVHPGHGPVEPNEFIPLLEETGLIIPVGEWVLAKVCEDLAQLRAQGLNPPRVAVNLSARQFLQQDLPARVEHTLAAHRVPADRLTLEITETLLMRDPASTVEVLHALKDIGVTVAVDDFGTGYSSLGYLKRFPIDELKVDKSFVDGLTHSSADDAIVEAIIRLAHSLRMSVVAEGVESESQHAFLKSHACDLSQGYLTGRPLEFDMFLRHLAEQAARPPQAPVPARDEFKPDASPVR
jgi:diguanylate cyclase (GGDEF)-like protein